MRVFVHDEQKVVAETREVDLNYVPVASAIKQLQNVSSDLIDPMLDLEIDGGNIILAAVRGYRPATSEEIAADHAEKRRLEWERENQKKRELEKAVRLLKEERPDLLKEEQAR